MAVAIKTNRINIRLADNDKKMLELAAKYSNQSLSNYIISIAIKQAETDLKKNEIIVLSNEERDRILKSFDNPEEPNEALKALFK